MNNYMLLLVLLLGLVTIPSVLAGNIMPLNCNGTFGQFTEGDDLCVYGTGFASGQNVDIYVIIDTDTIELGSTLVDQSESGKTTLTANTNGIISFANVWASIKAGFYDLVADITGNGIYDTEAVHNYKEGPAVVVEDVPEFGTIAALGILIVAGLFIYKKRTSRIE